MLQDMLADVVNGSDVAAALTGLLEEQTPTLAELRHGSKLTRPAVSLPPGQLPVSGDDSHVEAVAGDDTEKTCGDKGQALVPVLQNEQDEDASILEEDDVVDSLIQQPDFQEFAEFVLDSACFSLLQESAAGRWQAPSES